MFVTAHQIHDGKQFLPANTALEIADDGMILNIHPDYQGQAKHYEGILCPGFVNAHCHLELSHLKGIVPKHTGLIAFLLEVLKQRQSFSDEEKKSAREKGLQELYDNGVVAVGDISNTNDTMDLREQNIIRFHSFVEALGFEENFANESFDEALKVYQTFTKQEHLSHRQSITAHAPYSVSKKLFQLIDEFEKTSLLSIHNQETRAEDEYYKTKSGDIRKLLSSLHIDDSDFTPSGTSSLQTYLPHIAQSHPLILVHNSFTNKEDIMFIKEKNYPVFFCLCPNANLYIENSLPDVKLLMDENIPICIGTDSLTSNEQLCIYSELKTLHQHFNIDWETLLKWACYNGAKALQMDDSYGYLSPHYAPGIINIHKDCIKRIS